VELGSTSSEVRPARAISTSWIAPGAVEREVGDHAALEQRDQAGRDADLDHVRPAHRHHRAAVAARRATRAITSRSARRRELVGQRCDHGALPPPDRAGGRSPRPGRAWARSPPSPP
jgi:hypothetical protein